MDSIIQGITDIVRGFMQKQVAPFVNRVTGGRLRPDTVTYTSLLMHIPIAFLIAMQNNVWAAILLIIFGLLDALDGALARTQGRESAQGLLLDSTTDRMKEIVLYIGLAYAIIASTGRPYLAVWAVAACGCSLLTSYINAWGDAIMSRYKVNKHVMNKSFRGGLMPFQVRMFVIVIGLLSNHVALAVIVVSLGAAYTALSRLVGVSRLLNESNAQN